MVCNSREPGLWLGNCRTARCTAANTPCIWAHRNQLPRMRCQYSGFPQTRSQYPDLSFGTHQLEHPSDAEPPLRGRKERMGKCGASGGWRVETGKLSARCIERCNMTAKRVPLVVAQEGKNNWLGVWRDCHLRASARLSAKERTAMTEPLTVSTKKLRKSISSKRWSSWKLLGVFPK